METAQIARWTTRPATMVAATHDASSASRAPVGIPDHGPCGVVTGRESGATRRLARRPLPPAPDTDAVPDDRAPGSDGPPVPVDPSDPVDAPGADGVSGADGIPRLRRCQKSLADVPPLERCRVSMSASRLRRSSSTSAFSAMKRH